MNTTTRKLILIVISAFFGFTACKNRDQQSTPSRVPRLPAVYVEPAKQETMTAYIDITGSVQANVVSEVTAPVDGVIEHLYARENQRVKKDGIIAVINPNDRVALIANNLKTIQEIEARIAGTNAQSEDYPALMSELDKAKINLEYAKSMYQTVPVICPMDGIVTERWADKGSQIGFRDKIITISDMSSLVIKAEVNETYFESIRQGRTLPVMLAAYPNDSLSGRISLVYPQIERTTRSVKFDIKVQHFNKPLLPGMMAQIRIPVLTNENAVTVAEDAVLTSPENEYFLFVVGNDSIVSRRSVETGMAATHRLEITSGLEEGEHVVVMGQHMLKNNTKVQILATPK